MRKRAAKKAKTARSAKTAKTARTAEKAKAAKAARAAKGAKRRTKLRGISDIRRFFHRNDEPVYFISATPFNLLGIDEWVRNFHFINYIDCFDGQHPHVFVPAEAPHRPFTGIEDINNYLLSHKEVVDYIRSRGRPGRRGKAVFLFFDEQTEALCKELGLEVCFPSARLRQMVDNKIEATRIADSAGVPSVPNVLAPVKSWADLRKVSKGLGKDLVIQTAFGDSGHTTFFIKSEADYRRHADEIAAEPEVKVMRRVNVRGSALEACVTRHGTIVGPLMTELIGFPSLTPYRGGWCGNEVHAEAFPKELRHRARKATFAFGEALRKRGYRGYFELDFLTDRDTGALYLGEVNPRITGASAMTNLAAFAQADAPLFLFHLLEWFDVDFQLDVEALNARWADPDNIDSWGQLVIKHTDDSTEWLASAPRSGVWRMRDDGEVEFVRIQTHRRTVESEQEAFFLRIAGHGDVTYEGADLGILITPGRLMTATHRLNKRARNWTEAIKGQYRGQPLTAKQAPVAAQVAEVGGFKLL